MSFYNFLHGENKDSVALIGMLGLTKNSFSRYRDVYLNSDGSRIIVLTRLGGANRKDYRQVFTNMKRHPNYIKDYDDNFDNTYAYFEFSVPDEYKKTCQSMSTGKEPMTLEQRFKETVNRMDIPGTPEYEKAQQIVQMMIDATENDNGNIHFLEF